MIKIYSKISLVTSILLFIILLGAIYKITAQNNYIQQQSTQLSQLEEKNKLVFNEQQEQLQQLKATETELAQYLTLSEKDVLNRRIEISQLQGIKGQIMKLILTYIAVRSKSTDTEFQGKPLQQLTTQDVPSSPLEQQNDESKNNSLQITDEILEQELIQHGIIKGSPNIWSSPIEGEDKPQPHEDKSTDYQELMTEKDVLKLPKEENKGITEETFANADSFLNNHQCLNPGFVIIDEKRRELNNFFTETRNKSFAGKVHLYGQKTSLNISFSQKNSKDLNVETLEVVGEDKKTYEIRTLKYSQNHNAWRYSSCSEGIILFQNRCPWNKNYDLEYKEFYYLTKESAIIANVYCTKNGNKQWTLMGTIKMKEE